MLFGIVLASYQSAVHILLVGDRRFFFIAFLGTWEKTAEKLAKNLRPNVVLSLVVAGTDPLGGRVGFLSTRFQSLPFIGQVLT